MVGVSSSTVYNYLKNMDISIRNRSMCQKPIELDLNVIKTLYYVDSLSLFEISKRLNCSEETIRRFMVKNNLTRREKTINFGGQNKGVKMSDEQRSRLSNTVKLSYKEGRVHWNTNNKTPLETRKKISKSLLNVKSPSPKSYGKDWRINRTTRLQIDNYTCQQCGGSNKLEVHHWEPYRFSFDNSIDNLITLCRSCHIDIHKNYRLEGFIKEMEGEIYG